MNHWSAADCDDPHAYAIPLSQLRIGGTLSLEISPALLNLAARSKTKRFPWRPTAIKQVLSR